MGKDKRGALMRRTIKGSAHMELTQELKAIRKAEYEAAKAKARNALEAYYAGSASASVLRDYQAGRVVIIEAK
jgi:hypothetical protein